jgi:hypothetical protein
MYDNNYSNIQITRTDKQFVKQTNRPSPVSREVIPQEQIKRILKKADRYLRGRETYRSRQVQIARAKEKRARQQPYWLPYRQMCSDLPVGQTCWFSVPHGKEASKFKAVLAAVLLGASNPPATAWCRLSIAMEGDMIRITKVGPDDVCWYAKR